MSIRRLVVASLVVTLAKMADSLDEISNGRFILGLGCGWHAPEFLAFGYWNMDRVLRPERVAELRRSMAAACREIGREPATLPVTAWTAVQITRPDEVAAPDPEYVTGSPEEIAALLQGFADAGVDHLAVRVKPPGREGVERLHRVRELLGS